MSSHEVHSPKCKEFTCAASNDELYRGILHTCLFPELYALASGAENGAIGMPMIHPHPTLSQRERGKPSRLKNRHKLGEGVFEPRRTFALSFFYISMQLFGFYVTDAKLTFLDFNNDFALCMPIFNMAMRRCNLIQRIHLFNHWF